MRSLLTNTTPAESGETASIIDKLTAKPLPQSIIQQAPIAIVGLDREAIVRIWNRAAERIFGWTEREALNRTSPILSDSGDDRKAYYRALQGETVNGLEVARRTKDGRQVEIGLSVAPLHNDGGEVGGVVEWMVDNSLQKRTCHDLKNVSGALRRAYTGASMFESIMDTPPAGQPANWFGEDFLAPLHPDDRYKLAAAIQTVATTGARTEVAYRTVNAEGGESYFRERIEAVLDDSGRVARIARTTQDVTESARLRVQLERVERLATIGRLTGGVIHDFKNLVTLVAGHNAIIIDALDERSPLRTNALQIQTACERAGDLARQLLAFSRGEAVRPTIVDLNAIVHEVGYLLQPITGKNINWLIQLDPRGPRIRANSGQIHQALVNLILNARDAMPDGGTLTLETLGVHLDRQEAGAGWYALLAVSDTGCGFDEETRNHLFEPLFTTKQKGGSSGCGLATVKRIVTETGGWIRVHSEPGKGARFEVYLPQIHQSS